MTASILYAQKTVVDVKPFRDVLPAESEDVMVAPELASSWLQKYNYAMQRPLRPMHVEYLAEEMRRGKFRQGTQIHFVRSDDKLNLVNGQHTLSAIALSGKPQTLSVCYTSEDPAEAYYRHDVHLKRNTVDMYSALQLGDELGFSASQLNKIGVSARFIFNNFSNLRKAGQIHPDDHLRMIREFADSAQSYLDVSFGSNQFLRSSVYRAATMAVALVTYRYAASKYGVDMVNSFWRGAIFDDAVPSGDPRKVAHTHMMTVEMYGSGSRGGKIRATPNYSSRYLANCWNAFTEGRQLTKTYVNDQGGYISINGTPFAGEGEVDI